MEKILAGVARFQSRVFPEYKDHFAQIAFEQKPRALFITCADSRVMPNLITQCRPGELFQCRDVGNIVPPYGGAYGGVSATIEYSISVLGVKHVIVCGHSDCGAMRALLNHDKIAKFPAVLGWLQQAEAARRTVLESGLDLPEDQMLQMMIEQNVRAQLTNLRTHPAVASKMARGELSVHGWVYDIEHGTVSILNPQTDVFEQVGPEKPGALVESWEPGEAAIL
jgi:carbonic anhydrase